MCRIEWRTNDLANTLDLVHTLRANFNLALTDSLYLPDRHNQCVALWPVPIPCPCSCRPGCARRHETHRRTGKTHRSTAHSWCRCHSIGGIEPIQCCQRLAHIPGGSTGPKWFSVSQAAREWALSCSISLFMLAPREPTPARSNGCPPHRASWAANRNTPSPSAPVAPAPPTRRVAPARWWHPSNTGRPRKSWYSIHGASGCRRDGNFYQEAFGCEGHLDCRSCRHRRPGQPLLPAFVHLCEIGHRLEVDGCSKQSVFVGSCLF